LLPGFFIWNFSGMSSEHHTGCNTKLTPYLSAYQFFEKRGWPTMLLVLGIVFIWVYVIPLVDRVADAHIGFVNEVKTSVNQMGRTLIILEERDRKRDDEFRQILDRLTKPRGAIGNAE
jgi:hypothetical protein